MSSSVSLSGGMVLITFFVILTCGHPCFFERKASLRQIGTLGHNYILGVLVFKKVECVVESMSSSLLELLCVSVVEVKDVSGSEMLIWRSGCLGRSAVIVWSLSTLLLTFVM